MTYVFGKFLCTWYFQRLGERTQAANAELNHVAEEAIGTIRTVKSFACEEKEVANYEEKLAKMLKVIQVIFKLSNWNTVSFFS